MARYVCVTHPERHETAGFSSITIGAEGHPFTIPGPCTVCGLTEQGRPCHSPLAECAWCGEVATANALDPDTDERVFACSAHADALLSMALPACRSCGGPVDYPTEWDCAACARPTRRPWRSLGWECGPNGGVVVAR